MVKCVPNDARSQKYRGCAYAVYSVFGGGRVSVPLIISGPVAHHVAGGGHVSVRHLAGLSMALHVYGRKSNDPHPLRSLRFGPVQWFSHSWPNILVELSETRGMD